MPKQLEKVALTPAQAKKWMETRAATIWAQPGFSDVWYALMTDKDGETAYFTKDGILEKTCAGTDGRYLFINPESYFEKYNLDQRVFINCHEIMHAILDHPGIFANWKRLEKVTHPDGRVFKYDELTAQRAGDMLINDTLTRGRVGERPDDATYDPSLVTENDTIYDAYAKVYLDKKSKEKGGGKGKDGQGGAGQGNQPGFDKNMQPGTGDGADPEQATADRNDGDWSNAVQAAMGAGQGRLPAGVERMFAKVLEPEVKWSHEILSLLSRRLGNSASSWSTLDQHLIVRGIGAPGRIAYGCGTIVFAIDTSGSIDQGMMDIFMSEAIGAAEVYQPQKIIMMQCDAAVHEVVEINSPEDLAQRKIIGGGGTSFIPVFERISEIEKPDAVIYFTDLFGSFPDEPPDYPVIWASITKGHPVPWGDIVDVPLRKGAGASL